MTSLRVAAFLLIVTAVAQAQDPSTYYRKPARPDSALLSVGGSYPTKASLLPDQNTCGSEPVEDVLARVKHVYNIQGQFTLYGFDATVSVSINDQAPKKNCVYAEHWVGTMVGAANTIPGG